VTFTVLPSENIHDVETRQKHVAYARQTGFPFCKPGDRDRPLAIVGSGPSVADYLHELQRWPGDIWAINGAFDFLDENGIDNADFIGCDPQSLMTKFLQKPRKDAKYYLATLCHPEVFDLMKGYDVRLWNMSEPDMEFQSGEYAIYGGSTCLTRAPFLASFLGYKSITVYGADSSYTETTHAGNRDQYNFPKDRNENIFVKVDGRTFETNAPMAHQASNICAIRSIFGDKVEFRCGGLAKALLQSTAKDFDALVGEAA
jgi:hypothetical protein